MDTARALPLRGVVILGPERSGTSLTASVVDYLGALVRGGSRRDRFNERGYWEDEAVVGINERLLERIGVNWTWAPPPHVPWVGLRSVRRLTPDAVAVLRELETQERWASKDPRFSVTLPFWKPLFTARVGYLVCLRNPLSVARSLAHRNGVPVSTAGLYWSNRMLHSLVNTAGAPRMIVPYEDFFANGTELTHRIADFLGWPKPTTPVTLPAADLDHGRATVADLASSASLPTETRLLYLSLQDHAYDPAMVDVVTQALSGSLEKEKTVETMLRIYAGGMYNRIVGRRIKHRGRLRDRIPGLREAA